MNKTLRTGNAATLRALSKFARLIAVVATLPLSTACDAPVSTRPEPSYNPTALTGGLYYHWANGNTISVAIAASDTGLPAAVERAITAWNAVPQFGEFVLIIASSPAVANIVVYDAIAANPIQPSGACAFDPHGAGGYTYFCPVSTASAGGTQTTAAKLPFTGGGGMATVVIRVDRGRATSAAQYDALVAHEFGHALGIGAHSDVPSDLMFSNPSAVRPTARDQTTLRFVLGKTPDLRL